MRISISLAVMAALISVSPSAAQSSEPQPEAASPPVEAVRAILDQALLNYPETRFRDVRYVAVGMSDGPKTFKGFCGEINTQNRMGGFTGWARFFVSPDPVMGRVPDRLFVAGIPGTLDDYSPGITANLVNTFCTVGPEPLSDEDFTAAVTYERVR